MKNKGFVFVETIVCIIVLTLGLMTIYISFNSVLSNDKRRAMFNDVDYIYRTYYIEDFLTSLNIEDWLNYYLGPEVKEGSTYISGGKKIQEFNCNNPSLYKIDSKTTNEGLIGQNAANKKTYTALTADTANMPNSELAKKYFCESLYNSLNIKHIYITNYNINDLKMCTTYGGKISTDSSCDKNKIENIRKFEALYTMSNNMIYFLRTLSGKEAGAYRLIVEYEEKVKDSDKSVTKSYFCPSGYRNKDGQCQGIDNPSLRTAKVLKCPDGYSENASGDCERVITRNYYSSVKLIAKSSIKE